MDLKEWCIHYIKFKDAMKRAIVSIEETDKEITVTEKTRTVRYFVDPQLEHSFGFIDKEISVVVCCNTKENVEKVVKTWDLLMSLQNLTIIFVNITTNDKWLLHPSTHHNVVDGALEQGLLSLYENVGGYYGN